jgi:hypothetical protein
MSHATCPVLLFQHKPTNGRQVHATLERPAGGRSEQRRCVYPHASRAQQPGHGGQRGPGGDDVVEQDNCPSAGRPPQRRHPSRPQTESRRSRRRPVHPAQPRRVLPRQSAQRVRERHRPTGGTQLGRGMSGQPCHVIAVPLPSRSRGRWHRDQQCRPRPTHCHRHHLGEQPAQRSGQPVAATFLVREQHLAQRAVIPPECETGGQPRRGRRRTDSDRAEGFQSPRAPFTYSVPKGQSAA